MSNQKKHKSHYHFKFSGLHQNDQFLLNFFARLMFQLFLVFILVVLLDVGRGVRVFTTSITSYHFVKMLSRWTSMVEENPSDCYFREFLLQISCFAFQFPARPMFCRP